MKTKTVRFFVESFLFVAAVVAMAPPVAMAAGGNNLGEFSVPVEVHWGGVTLERGGYSISTVGQGSSSMVCLHKEGSPAAGYFIPAVGQEMIPVSTDRPQLVLGKRDGTLYVKELMLGAEGMDLHYAPPKLKK